MKLGIVGLPNVGKSTLFNALTSTQNAQAANYPFCTIEPNSGIVPVPDARLDKLAEIWQTDKKTPAIVEFVDIAGLVKGASQGAGLGNKFLGHIRECDAIVHVVRCFDDDNIIHVVEDVNKPESVDPIRDIDAIDLELILADLEVVSNRLGRQQKAAKTGNKAAAAEAGWLAELASWLEGGKPARSFDFDEGDDAQKAVRKELGLLSAKPVIYACNVGEDDLLGGLDFDVPMDMDYDDPDQNLFIHLKAGEQHLTGEQLMWVVRFRSGYANADIGRTEVQRAVMKTAMKQWLRPKTLAALPGLWRIYQENLTTDLSVRNIVWMARVLLKGMSGDIEANVLPGYATMAGDASVYMIDTYAASAILPDYSPYK